MKSKRLHLVLGLACVLAPPAAFAGTPVYEEPPISYSTTAPDDPASRLKAAIERGTAKLTRDDDQGYLRSLLKELKIPVSSQMLVFSRTSFQRNHISPKHPRAIYFNDDTYVGYVPGAAMIEVASSDPKLGTTFYTVDQDVSGGSTLLRQTANCLQCHGESMTHDTPGLLVRSVFVDDDAQPIQAVGGFISTHESPLKERWGGWYVTGSTGSQHHMGNTRWREKDGSDPEVQSSSPANVNTLPDDVDASAYPSPHSDLVALMVLEHQTEGHNRFTRAAHGTLRALRDEQVLNEAFGKKSPSSAQTHSQSTLSRIKSSCEPLVEYLLFAGEMPLTDKVVGSSAFAAEFSARGPRDSKGRSLRDFDLRKRLLRFPCSYLVYSAAFDGLPEPARDYLYRRLWEVLISPTRTKPFQHISAEDAAAVSSILRETKPQLAKAWSKLEKPNE